MEMITPTTMPDALPILWAPHKSESVSDKNQNKFSDRTPSSRDNHFRTASVTSIQRSDDKILQKSSLERKGNSSYDSILSIESSISIRYRSRDGQRRRVDNHSKSEIALGKHTTLVAGSTPTEGDFLLVDNDDSDDDENHGSANSRVGPVEPENFPIEKMGANDFSSGESDHASAFRESDSRITRLENNFLRLRFRCRCGHQFKIDILEHQKNAAIELLKAFDGSPNPERKSNYLSLLQRIFEQARLLLGTKEIKKIDHVLPVSRDNVNDADNLTQSSLGSLPPEPDRYICACFPGTNYKKYLHHVDANKARTDPMLFQALQQKYFSWRPLWKRMLALRVLARVEYFELQFQIFYSNLVTIHEDWKDRFPRDHAPGEWLYIPSSRDTTPYLFDDILTHYVQNPVCAKNCTYFWNRIPKKVKQPLECPDGQQSKVGWGLYFIEEFSQL
ncbi:MAG: hypothetical protein Q9214_004038 [Letrouitia sp. 1 TL-2023]